MRLTNNEYGRRREFVATADAGGCFKIEAILGKLSIMCSHRNYVPYAENFWPVGKTSHLRIKLRPAESRIEIIVKDADTGLPVNSANVEMSPENNTGAQTNSEGIVKIGVIPGVFDVRVSHPEFAPAEAESFEVKPGETRKRIVAVKPLDAEICGKVSLGFEEVRPNELILIARAVHGNGADSGFEFEKRFSLVGYDMSFSMRVPSGRYAVICRAERYGDFEKVVDVSKNEKVELGVKLEPVKLGEVTGRVVLETGGSVTGLFYISTTTGGIWTHRQIVTERGEFSVPVQPGNVVVAASYTCPHSGIQYAGMAAMPISPGETIDIAIELEPAQGR